MTTILEALNAALHQSLRRNPNVIVLGEDILDPYGGAFKVTRGLSTAFPDRVWTTPISEAGLAGIATGMALRGLRPVLEIMFGDFLTLTADQLLNSAAKFRGMYNQTVSVPLVVRTPMGGRRGYGPTHSQTLEKHFMGMPGLTVLAPSTLPGGCQALLEWAILESSDPVLFIENKLQYLLPLADAAALADFTLSTTHEAAPTYTLNIAGAPAPQLTLASYGYMADLARQAVQTLAYQHEVFAELVVPTQLSPMRYPYIIDSAQRTRRLLTVEENGLSLGWGAEVLAQTVQALPQLLLAAKRLAAADCPIPAAPALEKTVLPGVDEIVHAALQLIHPEG